MGRRKGFVIFPNLPELFFVFTHVIICCASVAPHVSVNHSLQFGTRGLKLKAAQDLDFFSS